MRINTSTTYSQTHFRHHLWPGLLALVIFVLQPLLMAGHCDPVSAHTHFEGQSYHHVHEESELTDSRSLHHNEHHQHSQEHPQQPQDLVSQTIALYGMSVSSNHSHKSCCLPGETPAVTASVSSRHGANEGDRVPISYAALIVSPLQLDVVSGIRSRAGPSHTTPLSSYFLRSTLLGRAPPRLV